MVMKILIIIFFFLKIKESKITRGHNLTLVKNQSRLDVRKFSFSQSVFMLVVLIYSKQYRQVSS